MMRSHRSRDLLGSLERHIKEAGVAPSAIGRLIANDPQLVFDLRAGREPGTKIVRQIEQFIVRRDAFLSAGEVSHA